MKSHTPGPWTAERATPNTINIDASGVSIGEVYDGTEETDSAGNIAEANARLIAAAPELLEALESIAENLQNKTISTVRKKAFRMNPQAEAWRVYLSSLIIQARNQASYAIAKAKGIA